MIVSEKEFNEWFDKKYGKNQTYGRGVAWEAVKHFTKEEQCKNFQPLN